MTTSRYYRKHAEKIRANARAYYWAHREDRQAYSRTYGATHRPKQLAYAQKRTALAHAFVDAAMAGGCVDCGTKEQVVLELDHVRGQKVAHVNRLLSASFTRLFAEIDKCETRCANCHRRVTAERRRVA